MNKSRICSIIIAFIIYSTGSAYAGISPSLANASYWQYNGEPILLLGGSSEDNLFQVDNLQAELDRILSCGGNYVRNTLSSRDPGNVWAFGIDKESGKYDLNTWNDVYWERLDSFFKLTSEREIFVQVELWATFDFYRESWLLNPFNPRNNINYNTDRTRISEDIPTHPTRCDNRFFWSVPMQDNNMPVLAYQQKFIDKVLSYSLKYDHILYCIDNETSVTAAWGRFWAEYIHKKAEESGRKVYVTEMWDPHDLNHISHRESFDHPETYDFVEISQNNHKKGQQHWDNGLMQLARLDNPHLRRPVNNVKTYGSDSGRHGHGSQNGKESFIRNIFFGSASTRFHRPPSGQGISDEAMNVIQSTRMITDSIDFFSSTVANSLLQEREDNEAYCRSIRDNEAIVFFTDGGEVQLMVEPGMYSIRWLDISQSRWGSNSTAAATSNLTLKPPADGMWFALIQPLKNGSN
ncbi:MAG: hypothetical protein AB3N63_17860 [Puniceicoccaceae bacterium]